MTSTRIQAIDALRAEARALRAWADAHLPERERIEPYMMAARLERTARELAAEPTWLRWSMGFVQSTRAVIHQAQVELKRRTS